MRGKVNMASLPDISTLHRKTFLTKITILLVRLSILKMNPTSNVMSKVSRSVKRLQQRKRAAVVQLLFGFTAVSCGLNLVWWKNRGDYIGFHTARFGKPELGIWAGLVFIVATIPHFFGRHKKSMVGLYFGSCLVSAVIAIGGLGFSITAINRIMKPDTSVCKDTAMALYRRGKYHCCIEKNWKEYECRRPSYNHHNSGIDNDLLTTDGPPPLSYHSLECFGARVFTNKVYGDCLQEAERLYKPHLFFYGVMVFVFFEELLASALGAFASLSELMYWRQTNRLNFHLSKASVFTISQTV